MVSKIIAVCGMYYCFFFYSYKFSFQLSARKWKKKTSAVYMENCQWDCYSDRLTYSVTQILRSSWFLRNSPAEQKPTAWGFPPHQFLTPPYCSKQCLNTAKSGWLDYALIQKTRTGLPPSNTKESPHGRCLPVFQSLVNINTVCEGVNKSLPWLAGLLVVAKKGL